MPLCVERPECTLLTPMRGAFYGGLKSQGKVIKHDRCVHSHRFIISFLYSTTSQTLKPDTEVSEQAERWGSYSGSRARGETLLGS